MALTFFASAHRTLTSKQNMITIAPPAVPLVPQLQNVAFGALAAVGLGLANDAYNTAVGANPIKDGALIKALESESGGV